MTGEDFFLTKFKIKLKNTYVFLAGLLPFLILSVGIPMIVPN